MSINISDFVFCADDQFVLECARCPRERKRRLIRDDLNFLLIAANYQGWRVVSSELHCGKCAAEVMMAARYANKFKEGE